MHAEPFSRSEEPGRPVLKTFATSDGYRHVYRHFDAKEKPIGPRSRSNMVLDLNLPVEPRGTIVFVHGIQSHGGWYPRSCAKLAEAGFDVFFLDRRGAGLNRENRGDTPSFRRLLDDIAEFIGHIPRGPKTFLGGISWGGKLAAAFPYRHPGILDGMLLLCPGFFPQVRPPFFQRLWIGRCRLRKPLRLFPVPLSEPELFTESKSWQQFIAEDLLSTRMATARFLFESFSLDFYLKRAVKRVEVPVLMLLAENEKVIFNAKTRKWVEAKFRSKDKTVIEYPWASHTLEFEGDEHAFTGDMIEWLESRI